MRTNHNISAILTILEKKKKMMSIKEIHAQLPEVHMTTIYRNIKQLVQQQKINTVSNGDELLYEIQRHGHIHTKCNNCNTIACAQLPSKQLENIESHIQKKVQGITIEVTCTNCEA